MHACISIFTLEARPASFLIIYAISWCRLAQLHRQHHERGEPPAGGPQDQGDESHRSGTLPEPPPQLIPPRAESIFYLIFVKVYKLFLVTPEVQIRAISLLLSRIVLFFYSHFFNSVPLLDDKLLPILCRTLLLHLELRSVGIFRIYLTVFKI